MLITVSDSFNYVHTMYSMPTQAFFYRILLPRLADVATELGDDKAEENEGHAEEFLSFWAFVEVESGEADEDDQGDGFLHDF